jgi:tetratricopeptide (TPR) repeat protein
MPSQPPNLNDFAERGIDHCRQGEWDAGMAYLVRVAEKESRAELPSTYHSYLGYGLAHRKRQVREGLELCRHACQINFYEPENFLNLARTCLLAGNREEAFEAIGRGYALDPGNRELRGLHDELGIRRPPVIRFLGRRNLINRLLGRFRHDLGSGSATAAC